MRGNRHLRRTACALVRAMLAPAHTWRAQICTQFRCLYLHIRTDERMDQKVDWQGGSVSQRGSAESQYIYIYRLSRVTIYIYIGSVESQYIYIYIYIRQGARVSQRGSAESLAQTHNNRRKRGCEQYARALARARTRTRPDAHMHARTRARTGTHAPTRARAHTHTHGYRFRPVVHVNTVDDQNTRMME